MKHKIINDQSGKIVSWTLLIITGIWTLFYLTLNEVIKARLSYEYLRIFQGCLVILSFSFLGLAIRASKKGRFAIRGDKTFAKKIQTYYEKINEIIEENESILEQIRLEVEKKSQYFGHSSHIGMKAAEDILNDLKLRSKKIDQNMRNGSNANLIAADSLIRSTTAYQTQIIKRDSHNNNNPQQALDDTSAKLKRIFQEIKMDQKKNLSS